MKRVYVINSRGEKELFSVKKIYRGVRKSGVKKELAKRITKIIQKEIFSGIRTCEIAKRIKEILLKESPREAIKFSLKEGMLKLGPSGFLFEKYIGEIFSNLGYRIKLNLHPRSSCGVRYEIDFLAKKGKTLYLGECKYHNKPGRRIDLEVALANYARYLDLKNSPLKEKNYKIKSLLVTNTKFTSQAINYSNCVGVLLLGWNWPRNKGLQCLIEKKNLYPITILSSLEPELKSVFVKREKMLAKDVLRINPQKLSKIYKIPLWKFNKLIKDAETLLG